MSHVWFESDSTNLLAFFRYLRAYSNIVCVASVSKFSTCALSTFESWCAENEIMCAYHYAASVKRLHNSCLQGYGRLTRSKKIHFVCLENLVCFEVGGRQAKEASYFYNSSFLLFFFVFFFLFFFFFVITVH